MACIRVPLIICIALMANYAFGQDLGSSNKLFGGAKPTVAAPTKKASPKPKSTAKKSKTTRPSAAAKATAKPKVSVAPSTVKIAPKTTWTSAESLSKTTIITIGPAANELFNKLIAEGNAGRDRRDYAAAEAAYRRAHETNKNDSRALYGLGNLFSDQQRWSDAEAAYRSAMALGTDDPYVYIALSYVLTQPIAAPNLFERYEEAELLSRKALQLDPKNALAYDQFGVALELRGLVGSETENAYRKAIAISPGFAPAHAHLGRLLRRKGRIAEAAAAYATAVEKANDVMTLILVADVMQSELRFADSIPLLNRALASDTRNPSALLMLGRAHIKTGNLAAAESSLTKAIAVARDSFTANSLLGTLFIRQNRLDAAENALLQASRFTSAFDKAGLGAQFEAVGDGYLLAGNARAAERLFRKALTLAPERAALEEKIRRASKG